MFLNQFYASTTFIQIVIWIENSKKINKQNSDKSSKGHGKHGYKDVTMKVLRNLI